MEVQAKLYYGKKIQAGRKSSAHTKYVKYGKEEDRIKALIGLKHEGGVVATEERNVNVRKSKD